MTDAQLNWYWGFTVAIFAVGGMIGSLCAGVLAGKLGLKYSFLVNNFVAIPAALLMGFSKQAGSFEMLIVGKDTYLSIFRLCIHTNTRMHTRLHIRTYVHTNAQTHALHTRTHACTHTCTTHTRTHACTHTHTHTQHTSDKSTHWLSDANNLLVIEAVADLGGLQIGERLPLCPKEVGESIFSPTPLCPG